MARAIYMLSMPYGLSSRYHTVVPTTEPRSPMIAPRLPLKNGRKKPIIAITAIESRKARVKKDSFRSPGAKNTKISGKKPIARDK